VIRATHVEPSAGAYAAADKPDRAVIHKPEKAAKGDTMQASERSANADKPAPSDDRDDEPAADTETRNTTSPDVIAGRIVRAADAGH
jgi:ribonuclease-3